jgi:hypothetical protein
MTSSARKRIDCGTVRPSALAVLRYTEPTATLLRDELAALGDVDGKNIRLDFRLADGEAGRFPALAEALVREKASVIVAQGPAAAQAAQRATRSIPIVAAGSDLVALGLVDSMARPGHNITGVSLLIPELDAKRLEVLKDILPTARRFGLLNDPSISEPVRLRAISDIARALGVELQTVHAREPRRLPRRHRIPPRRWCRSREHPFLAAVVPLQRRAWSAAPRAQACLDLRMAGNGRFRVSGELRDDPARALFNEGCAY